MDYSLWGRKGSDTTERLTLLFCIIWWEACHKCCPYLEEITQGPEARVGSHRTISESVCSTVSEKGFQTWPVGFEAHSHWVPLRQAVGIWPGPERTRRWDSYGQSSGTRVTTWMRAQIELKSTLGVIRNSFNLK